VSCYPSDRQGIGFAIRYLKWLFDSGASTEIGPDAVALITAVVICEDELHYERAPNFFNEQLARRCGIASVHALIRARDRAVAAGLLVYEPATKRNPGRYFVCGFHAQSARKAEGKRKESATLHTPTNNHLEEERIEFAFPPELTEWVVWWNGLHTRGLVTAGSSLKPNKTLVAAYRRAMGNPKVMSLLSDKNAIERAIAESSFVQKPWFRLAKLFGAKNKSGEYIVSELLSGSYRDIGGATAREKQRVSDVYQVKQPRRV
jgi:hypothetical protein